LVILACADGTLGPPTIIFRGKGLRISKEEKAGWHKGVKVLFQPKAWMDTPTQVEYTKRVLVPFMLKKGASRQNEALVLADNLAAHRFHLFFCGLYSPRLTLPPFFSLLVSLVADR
jgi:hypothetical protein